MINKKLIEQIKNQEAKEILLAAAEAQNELMVLVAPAVEKLAKIIIGLEK